MQEAAVVLGVLRERGRKGLPCTQLYRQMFNRELYLLAYGNIYSNQGAMTPGASEETADGMSEDKIEQVTGPLHLSFRSYVPLREIRLRDVDGVGDFFGVPGAAFGGGPAGCPLASGPVPGDGEDGGVQAGQGVIGAGGPVSAVPAAGVRGDVGPDEAEDGGERDEPGVEPGGSGSPGGGGGCDVVDEQQCPGFLAGQFRGLAAQWAAGAADGPLQMKERDFDLPSFGIQDSDFRRGVSPVVQQGGQ